MPNAMDVTATSEYLKVAIVGSQELEKCLR